IDPRLPDDDRPQLRRSAASDRLVAIDRKASGSNARQLETRRRCDHCRFGVGRGGEEALSARLESAQAISPDCAAAAIKRGRNGGTMPPGPETTLSFIGTKDCRPSSWSETTGDSVEPKQCGRH